MQLWKNWIFQKGVEIRIIVPIYGFVGFQEKFFYVTKKRVLMYSLDLEL